MLNTFYEIKDEVVRQADISQLALLDQLFHVNIVDAEKLRDLRGGPKLLHRRNDYSDCER